MKQVTLSEAKTNLSRYVEHVRRGGRVRILLRRLPVAELVPIPAPGETSDRGDESIVELERRGLVRRGKGGVPPEILRPAPRARGRGLSEVLIAERRADR
jgi:antitoxin (DNA-binding transcriptional repressor) of toxin-antitoxin stability system